jgi:hypothetical protein
MPRQEEPSAANVHRSKKFESMGFTSHSLNGTGYTCELLDARRTLSRATAVQNAKKAGCASLMGAYQPNQSEAEMRFSHCVRLSMQRSHVSLTKHNWVS